MISKKHKIGSFLLYILLTAIIIFSFIFVFPVYLNYKKMENKVERLEAELSKHKKECLQLHRVVQDLQHSSQAVEKVGREKFGLCEKNEIIYKYKVDKAKNR